MGNNESAILIVDDQEPVRKALSEYLGCYYTCATAANAVEMCGLLRAGSFKLVLADIQMAGASGLKLCRLVQKVSPTAVVILMSARTDIQYVIEAMRQGAYDYIIKPFHFPHLLLSVQRALRRQAVVAAEHRYEQMLVKTVQAKTKEVRSLNASLTSTLECLYTSYNATLEALAAALGARDVETRDHSNRVVAYCLRLGKELGLAQHELIALQQGALLHDIGKIGVPDAILLKPGPLTECERARMSAHVHQGLRIIDGIEFLSGARPVIGQHHERYDGSGYPIGLQGEEIHINARIFAVADAFDAITSDRPYRAAQSYGQARAEIESNSGKHFDPKVVAAFLEISEGEWAEIRCAAEWQQYAQCVLDRREISSYIVSLKTSGGVSKLNGDKEAAFKYQLKSSLTTYRV